MRTSPESSGPSNSRVTGSSSNAGPWASGWGSAPPAPSEPTSAANATAAAAPGHPPSLPASTSAAAAPPSANAPPAPDTPLAPLATEAAGGPGPPAKPTPAADAARTAKSPTEAAATVRSSPLRARVVRAVGGHPKQPTPASNSSTRAPSIPRQGARSSPRASGAVSTTVAITPNRRARRMNPPAPACAAPASGAAPGPPRGLNGPLPGFLPNEP